MASTQSICSVPGCNHSLLARGWCTLHYNRWCNHGNAEWQPPTTEDRFWAKVDKRGPNDCWEWKASKAHGYGRVSQDSKQLGAHRVAYEFMVGPIPDGKVLDHLCRNRGCVNPLHLEPVTPRINLLRGESLSAQRAKRTHCPQGHPYDLFNTRVSKRGQRICKVCSKEHFRRAYWRKKRALLAAGREREA